ncbi:MAG: ADP-ribosylglycohydrolase family protein, partial [Anaerolineae bacterium]|nr:ADP-ribosylglycohydrolase family protein [Anaerolineae bacterium]
MNTDLESTILYKKALGCLLGGLIGDAMGTPTEGKDYRDIEQQFGWVGDFDCSGTDDTVMKHLLSEALIRSEGYATLDDWAQVWLDRWEAIFGPKVGKFFISVLHTAHKLRQHAVPRMAALGNMPSSSSAMCIAPVGIVNACNPRQAAMQAYNLASLIHIHDVGFCQDGAAAIAAAVAAAFIPGATVDTVLETATSAILKLSGKEMLARIEQLLALAREAADYCAFRAAAYAGAERYFCRIICDSRETIPLALALFYLAEGDVEKSVCYAANFGRDADTTGAMCGAMAGALHGVGGIKGEWAHKVARYASLSQET